MFYNLFSKRTGSATGNEGASRSRARTVRPTIEGLENRELLTGAVSVARVSLVASPSTSSSSSSVVSSSSASASASSSATASVSFASTSTSTSPSLATVAARSAPAVPVPIGASPSGTLANALAGSRGLNPALSVASLSTSNSKGVTIDYAIAGGNVDVPIQVTIERSTSANPQASGSTAKSVVVATETIAPANLDALGKPAAAVGSHQINVSIPGGLPPDPAHPYVVAVVQTPAEPAATNPATDSASFQVYTIGVITHGGFENIFYGSHLPPWVMPMAHAMKVAGYNAVIPFNWVSKSSTPGAAIQQSGRLAADIVRVADSLPGTGPIDLRIIGHSEGNVVNTGALSDLIRFAPPRLQAGYIYETFLDPFAATNRVKHDFSAAPTALGSFASYVMNGYQHQSNDPLLFVPKNVAYADVFYQHTPYFLMKDVYDRTLNLWGQTPIPGANAYYDLTGIGIGHTDGFSVQYWYLKNVMPLIEHNLPLVVPQDPLSARLGPVSAGVSRLTALGTARPGAKIALLAIRGRSGVVPRRIGAAIAGPTGAWAITSEKLGAGVYRAFTIATAPAGVSSPPTVFVHMIRLGVTRIAKSTRK